MHRQRIFSDEEIASFMEMKTMGIATKRIANEYGCEPEQVQGAIQHAKRYGMSHVSDDDFRSMLGMPELAGAEPRMKRGSTAFSVEGVE